MQDPRRLLAAVFASALVAATASAGPFTSNGTQPGLAHAILPSSVCTGCHGNYDSRGNVEPGPTWQGAMMAQATRDPLFWAALDVANHDVPDVGDFCLRCHAPGAWLAGRSAPPGGSADGCGLLGNLDEQNGDFDGVTCHVCHRMEPNASPPDGQQSVYSENAQYWLDDGTCGGQGEPCRFGPYDYTLPGMTAAPHVWSYSTYTTSSQLCGTCHNVTNPGHHLLVDGVDAGIPFPIERTHREWEQSDYADGGAEATSCQGCHMPQATLSPVWASIFQLNDHTGDLAIHEFAGGNAWIPDVLRTEYPALGIDSSLAATADFARAMLASAASVTVDVPSSLRPGDDLTAHVSVTNLSGHKLPTGYPEGRRMWLDVVARDGNGALVFESGAYDDATGVLTRDAQVKVYEAKQGVWNGLTSTCETEDLGAEVFHFVQNDCVALDNRIPPEGFTGGADLETRPVGYSYPEVAPGILSNTDVTTYVIPVPAGAVTPITVTATLRYQTASKEYVDFLLDEATTHGFPDDCLPRSTGLPGKSRAAVLHDMWENDGKSPPVTMTAASAAVEVKVVDAFACAKGKVTKHTAPFVPVEDLALADDFGAGVATVKKLADLCAPADTGNGTLDADTWLTAFKLAGTAGAPQGALAVTDALGSLTVATTKPAMLLAPTALGAVPPAATTVDDFTCYKAKSASKLAKGLHLTVASALAPARTFGVKALQLLCVATDAGAGVKNASAALTCYKAAPAKGEPKLTKLLAQPIASALATLTVDATADALVCLPATVGSGSPS
jgi:hypothetical protein